MVMKRQEDRIPGAGQQTPSIAVAGFIHGCVKIFQNSCREIENAVHYEKEEILKLERLEIEKAAYNELAGLFPDNAGTIILDGALGAQRALRHQDRLFNQARWQPCVCKHFRLIFFLPIFALHTAWRRICRCK